MPVCPNEDACVNKGATCNECEHQYRGNHFKPRAHVTFWKRSDLAYDVKLYLPDGRSFTFAIHDYEYDETKSDLETMCDAVNAARNARAEGA